MAAWLIILVGFIYLFVSFDYWRQGDIGMAIAFFGYAFANYGLYLVGK